MGIEATLGTPLAEAVRKAGSQSAFGRMVGISQGYVHELLRNGKPLPAGCVLLAEAGTGVPRGQLRPDLYPDESTPSSASLDHRSDDSMEPKR